MEEQTYLSSQRPYGAYSSVCIGKKTRECDNENPDALHAPNAIFTLFSCNEVDSVLDVPLRIFASRLYGALRSKRTGSWAAETPRRTYFSRWEHAILMLRSLVRFPCPRVDHKRRSKRTKQTLLSICIGSVIAHDKERRG